ncbi:MAG: hypothetical protein ACPGJI_01620 [Kangiellaceae bacterium]
MPSKILSKIFALFAFLCLLLIIQTTDKSAPNERERASLRVNTVAQDNSNNRFQPFYTIYDQVFETKDPDKKLSLINQALSNAKTLGFTDRSILRSLHLSAAYVHQSRWHFLFAIDSLNQAQSLMFNSQTEKDIKNLQNYMTKIDSERGLKTQYIATKYSGPSKTLTGKILVTYVFVDDGISTRWSNKTKQRSIKALELIQSWQMEMASQYKISNMEFVNNTYVARKNPLLRQFKSSKPNFEPVSFKSSNSAINQFVTSAMNSLGAENVNDFLQKEMQKEQVNQAVLILHTNQDERSFAKRCGYTHQRKSRINGQLKTELFSNCTDEYVMLMEKVKRNRWDKLHYAQAHEIMHVFGAADLYNIKNASRYAVTDIMNYQSKYIKDSKIEPITAYAIGWTKTKPKAPFDILER